MDSEVHTTRRGQTNALLFFPILLMRFVKELNLNIDNFFEYKLIVRKKYHLWIRELIEYNKNKKNEHQVSHNIYYSKDKD